MKGISDLCHKPTSKAFDPETISLCSGGSGSWASCQTGQELWALPSQQWPSWGSEHGIGLHGKGAAEPFGAPASHLVASAIGVPGEELLGPVEQTLLVSISIHGRGDYRCAFHTVVLECPPFATVA